MNDKDTYAEADHTLDDCPEKEAGLRKLLEEKDCFFRTALEQKQ